MKAKDGGGNLNRRRGIFQRKKSETKCAPLCISYSERFEHSRGRLETYNKYEFNNKITIKLSYPDGAKF